MSQFQLTSPILHTSNYSFKNFTNPNIICRNSLLCLIFNETVSWKIKEWELFSTIYKSCICGRTMDRHLLINCSHKTANGKMFQIGRNSIFFWEGKLEESEFILRYHKGLLCNTTRFICQTTTLAMWQANIT